MKILFAEDNKIVRNACKDYMNWLGYDIDMALNGREAVDYARRNEGKYDLCIMDIDMPVMNGIQAAKIIRRNLKYFPILAFSGNPINRKKCLDVGMDDFLEKPCIPDKFAAKINELIIKSLKIGIKRNSIFIKKEMPMDQHTPKS